MLEIKVLDPGCANCRKLREALATTDVKAVLKVTDMQAIIAHDVLKPPDW